MKQMFLVRHAITDLAGKLCGHLDPPLNEVGRAQAASLAMVLRNLAVDRLYASDLRRCIETAEPLAHTLRISLFLKQNLREISFGAWEGMRWADVTARNAPLRNGIESSPELCPPGGERFNDFSVRVKGCLDEIATEHPEQTVAVVTHLGVIRTALIELAGMDPASELLNEIGYCSVHLCEISGDSWRLIKRDFNSSIYNSFTVG
jgi:broad specificity phosphatase PhoE